MKLRGLYAITPESGDVERKTRLALEGGIALLQYRQKKPDIKLARAIVRLGKEFGVPVIINDDVGLALDLGADGAHLGREDGELAPARKLL
ncbi:MAG TPA: thiamine phosphate synthase, partial [Burkholderiales bacterium]|nr:thiamine phosphate synthase [Burkholderiales bacterium]